MESGKVAVFRKDHPEERVILEKEQQILISDSVTKPQPKSINDQITFHGKQENWCSKIHVYLRLLNHLILRTIQIYDSSLISLQIACNR